MNKKHVSYPKIQQLRNVISNVNHMATYVGQDANDNPIYDGTLTLPTLKFTGSVKLHGCFESKTLVTLANGEQIPISEIEKGTYILSYDFDKCENVISKVTHVISQELHKEWCKLIFDDREIICTKDHKFWTTNREWVAAQNLTSKDIFLTS